jgi:hypothetical protein
VSNPTTLWIEKETFLLRKVYREQEFEDFRGQVTTTYKPVLDGEATERMLELDAPRSRDW